jgi:hypothetical protein
MPLQVFQIFTASTFLKFSAENRSKTASSVFFHVDSGEISVLDCEEIP